MKKHFTLEITTPCSENFDAMSPNVNGSFCNSCAKNVIDLSRKTNSEVAKFIAENKGKSICARLKTTQLEQEFEYNEFSKTNNFKYAAVAASILITSGMVAQEKEPVPTEINATKSDNYKMGKVAYNPGVHEEVSIVIKGKLLEGKTKKPFDQKKYPDLILTINNSESTLKIDPKTGSFSIPVQILKSSKSLLVTVSGNDYYLSKIIPFDINRVQNNILLQNITIDAEELSKVEVMILGGLGINYSDKKEARKI